MQSYIMKFVCYFYHGPHQLLISISLDPWGFLKKLLSYTFNEVINLVH